MSDPQRPIVHIYDDIEEHDNRLPRWWQAILYGTTVFALLYWTWFEVLHAGPSSIERFKAEKLLIAKEEAARLAADGDLTPDKLVAMAHNIAIVSEGKAMFVQVCASCHGPAGAGLVGPNLTDGAWIHGGRPEQIVATIRQGVVEKGMPAWGPQLGEDRVRKAAAFVLSIKGSNVPGKAPQGNPE